MSVARFISELIRAARDVDRLSMQERARLLNCAATALWDNRELLDFEAAPSDGPGNVVYDLHRIAERVHQYHRDQVQAALLGATEALKATLTLLQERHRIEQNEEETRRAG